MEAILAPLLDLINETLASAIVVVAASILFYNLTRNLNDRIDYFGTTVNMAARLEGKSLGSDLILSDAAYRFVGLLDA